MRKYKVGVWGQYGDGGPIADGQAVRTTITTEEIQKRYGKDHVLVLNTNSWKKHPLTFFLKTVGLLKKCDNLIILPADNGLKVIAPLIDLFNRMYRSKIFYIVIGGFLPTFLRKNRRYVKMLNKYEALFVQTPNIKHDLENEGIHHIEMMTNFKTQKIRQLNEIQLIKDDNIKLCIMSRLAKDKGVEDAVDAIRLVNDELGSNKIKLDLYGIVPDVYKQRFNKIIKENSEIVSYKGVVNYNETAKILKNYFAMLFPTYFHGEGFAGCIIDAFFAGIPIIATDWLYNKDVVVSGENGLLVRAKDPNSIKDAILKLYYDRDLAKQISENNVKEASNYTADFVLASLYKYLD